MKGKVLFVVGLGAGYVLGTRAGRQRYEQIKSAWLKVWEAPVVQKQVHAAQDYAADRIGDLGTAVTESVKRAVTKSNGSASKSNGSGSKSGASGSNGSASKSGSTSDVKESPAGSKASGTKSGTSKASGSKSGGVRRRSADAGGAGSGGQAS
ncbi:hypothetical protein GCM10028798_01850 [Humibacter antri]